MFVIIFMIDISISNELLTKCTEKCVIDSFDPLFYLTIYKLTHWGQVTHMWVGDLTITGSDNGLSPGRRQAIF